MKIRIVGDSVALTKDETLIRNSDKTYHVIFTFDESWNGYTKTATFKAGGRTAEVSVLNNECDIPSEILSTAGVMLKVQVSGSKNGESKATMWGNLSYILYETSVPLPPLPSSITKGYFHNGSFYNDAEYTSLIEPEEGGLYYDYSGKKIYVYDGENYNETSGSMVTAGRFLSYWDSETGLPKTDPAEIPYVYYTGDFYIVSDVPEDTTLYRPEGTIYDGTASTEEETALVGVFDFYFFDGEVWLLLKNSNMLAIGEGLSMDEDGKLSVDTTAIPTIVSMNTAIAAAIGDAMEESY